MLARHHESKARLGPAKRMGLFLRRSLYADEEDEVVILYHFQWIGKKLKAFRELCSSPSSKFLAARSMLLVTSMMAIVGPDPVCRKNGSKFMVKEIAC